MADAFLIVENLSKRYGEGPQAVHSLRGVDFDIARGEMVAIIGPSGCGKSTLLNLITGIDAPTSGRVILGGQDLLRLCDDERSDMRLNRIGFVFQSFNLFPTFTAEENVAWPLEFQGVPWREARIRSVAALAQVGIDSGAERRRPAELSGGEQQRVALARALVGEPELLVADEPTGNLDSVTGQGVLDLLRRLNKERGLTIVLVTHSPAAAAWAQRIITISDGRIVSGA